MKPDELIGLARALIDGPGATEPQWREAVVIAHRAIHLLVAAHLGLDPATFAGTPRAVGEALAAIDPAQAPGFIRAARRHFTTTWIARERAEWRPSEPFAERDARLCLAYAELVIAARAAAN
ncbi:MAG: hypothetical protein WDO24_18750 [Pseudomonadota bacterium]